MFMSEKKWEVCPNCGGVSSCDICTLGREWQAAYNEFFEAFKNYQETGNASRAKTMLKYVATALAAAAGACSSVCLCRFR